MNRTVTLLPGSWLSYGAFVVSGIVIGTTLLLFVPVHMGLSAGIASLSILIFTIATLITVVLQRFARGRARTALRLAGLSGLVGLLVPQLFFAMTAHDAGTHLRFDPLAYLTFSGETNLVPTRIMTYKTGGENQLELAYYAAEGDGLHPVVVILHGGGWRYGNHLQTGNWPRTLTRAGYSVIGVQYRLASENLPTWREAPQDVHDALAYVQAHAADFAVAGSEIHLLGQSAGGQLALLEAYRYQAVRSVISLYAPVDLGLDFETSRDKSAEQIFLGGAPSQLPDRYQELSPITHVTPKAPRSLLIQGKRDDLVTHDNATLLARTLSENDVEHTLVLLPLTGHSFENQHGGFATQIAEQSVLKFLDSSQSQ